MFKQLKSYARSIKQNLSLYKRILRDPECPWLAWIVLGSGVGYLLLPFDLIPDWIPVIGWLDDLILVPLLVWLGLQLVPEELIRRHQSN